MKTFKRFALPLTLLAVLVAVCPPAGLTQSRNKAPEPKAAGPLIRMDLLERAKSETGPPTRNIFAPRQASAVPATISQGNQSPLPSPNLPSDLPQTAGQGDTEPQAAVFSIDLRYIGFVVSPQKVIALIVFQGQTLAVAEGEVISEGIRVGKITKEQFEVILPDSSKRSFSLEGDEP